MNRRVLIMAGGLACAAAWPMQAAVAQPATRPAQDGRFGELEEVVVTARRREEALQSVPASITALSGAEIEARRILTAQDLQQIVPSLTLSNTGVRDGMIYTLRGQSTTLGAGPGVVVYFNEAPLPFNSVTSTNGGGPGLFFDLENLQVLKGPQGTLFGRNTTGGAVLLQPHKPTQAYEGLIQVGIGNYDLGEIQAVVNVPLADDRILVRASGVRQVRDGFTRNVLNGVDLDNRDNWAGRLYVTLRPTDKLQSDVLIFGNTYKSHGTGGLIQHVNPTGLTALLYPGVFGVPSIVQAGAAQAARGVRATAQNSRSDEKSSTWGVISTTRLELTESLSLRNIASYQRIKAYVNTDSDGSPIPVIAAFNSVDTKTITEELQLQGRSFHDRLVWTAGGYLDSLRPAGVQALRATSLAGSFIPPAILDRTIETRQRSRALYVQGTYDLGGLSSSLDKVRVTAGYRYTWDRRTDSFDEPDSSAACQVGAPPTCSVALRQSSEAGTWTVGLDYQATPTTLVYVRSSRGYKGGGANPSTNDPSLLTFKPEYVKDVELGLKRDWSFGQIQARTNVAVFHSDYTEIQRTVGTLYNGVPGSATDNVAKAKIDGVEFEGGLSPFRGLLLSASYSYLDARFTKGPPGFDLTIPFAYVPKNKYGLTASYRLPVDENLGDIDVMVSYARTGALFTAQNRQPGDTIPAYGLVNARLDWREILRSSVDVSAFITNATNKTYRVSGIPYYNSLGFVESIYGEPRMYGVQVRYSWK